MAEFDGPVREIFEKGANHVVLSVPRKDGTVQSVVVWANVIGDEIAVNSAEGRAWPANLRAAGTATVTAYADNDPSEWAAVTGTLSLDTHDGATDHINELSHKYIGQDYPWLQPGEQRITFTLRPERVTYVKM